MIGQFTMTWSSSGPRREESKRLARASHFSQKNVPPDAARVSHSLEVAEAAGTGRPRARRRRERRLDALSDNELLANYFAGEGRDDRGI